MTFSTRGDGWPMTSSLAGSNRTAMSVPCLRNTRCPVDTYLASAASCSRTCHSRVSSRSRASRGCESQPCLITVNSTAFPSGSQDGRRWLDSSRFGSGLVRVSGFPPSAETLERPESLHLQTQCCYQDPNLLRRSGSVAQRESARHLRQGPSSACRLPRIPPSGRRVTGRG